MGGQNNLLVVKYTTAAAPTMTNAAGTVVDYDTVVYDPYGLVTTGVAWVFTANHAGYYMINAAAGLDGSTGWAATELAYLQLYVGGGGSSLLDYRNDLVSAGSSIRVFLSGSTLIYCSVGTTLQVLLYQNSGGDIVLVNNAIYNHVAIWKV